MKKYTLTFRGEDLPCILYVPDSKYISAFDGVILDRVMNDKDLELVEIEGGVLDESQYNFQRFYFTDNGFCVNRFYLLLTLLGRSDLLTKII